MPEAGSPPLCARCRPLTARILESLDELGWFFVRLVALVIYVRACFERFGTQLARHRVSVFWWCFAACAWGAPMVVYVYNTFISLCVQHDASIGTCFSGGGGGLVAKMLALEAFDRSHTHTYHTEDLI